MSRHRRRGDYRRGSCEGRVRGYGGGRTWGGCEGRARGDRRSHRGGCGRRWGDDWARGWRGYALPSHPAAAPDRRARCGYARRSTGFPSTERSASWRAYACRALPMPWDRRRGRPRRRDTGRSGRPRRHSIIGARQDDMGRTRGHEPVHPSACRGTKQEAPARGHRAAIERHTGRVARPPDQLVGPSALTVYHREALNSRGWNMALRHRLTRRRRGTRRCRLSGEGRGDHCGRDRRFRGERDCGQRGRRALRRREGARDGEDQQQHQYEHERGQQHPLQGAAGIVRLLGHPKRAAGIPCRRHRPRRRRTYPCRAGLLRLRRPCRLWLHWSCRRRSFHRVRRGGILSRTQCQGDDRRDACRRIVLARHLYFEGVASPLRRGTIRRMHVEPDLCAGCGSERDVPLLKVVPGAL